MVAVHEELTKRGLNQAPAPTCSDSNEMPSYTKSFPLNLCLTSFPINREECPLFPHQMTLSLCFLSLLLSYPAFLPFISPKLLLFCFASRSLAVCLSVDWEKM
ncbi:hypothetical protein XENOCAPTIV_020272 [Xenoophorus captivus]|uniref:Uncharacterized protein n=1 Tax=Xenoophorus captivus TaxID=1517983 RepID=A0ABV0QW09_9TELE